MTFLENIDKSRLQKILLVVISALLLAALVCMVVIIVSSVTPPKPTDTGFQLEDLVLDEKTVITGSLVLADKDNKYSVDRSLLDLVECQTYRNVVMELDGITEKEYLPYKGMMLNKTAMAAAHSMLTAAKNNVGGKPITIDAAFDRIVYGGNDTEGYNTGLMLFLSDNTSESGKYVELGSDYVSWLKDNAAKYGFIESFEDAYRYVGEVHAKHMSEQNLTLAQYIEYLKENTDATKALTIKVGNDTYSVYYAEGKAGDTIKVPKTEEYTVSGTNEGGVIVTVKLAK